MPRSQAARKTLDSRSAWMRTLLERHVGMVDSPLLSRFDLAGRGQIDRGEGSAARADDGERRVAAGGHEGNLREAADDGAGIPPR